MEIVIQSTPKLAAIAAARQIAYLVREKPTAVLGLATGSTPLPLYRELIRLHQEESLDFSRVTTFNLDEYVGLHPSHPASYHAFMHENLFDHLNIHPTRTHIPDGLAKDVPLLCHQYETAIREAGGIDLQVLGIGTDGHIGFNEPSSSLASRTRIKTITTQTRLDNAFAFEDPQSMPIHVVTMGVGTIMESQRILLLAFGPKKAHAVAAAVEGPISASQPASILQMHPVTQYFLDDDAAANLSRLEYYRWVYQNKPDWQRV